MQYMYVPHNNLTGCYQCLQLKTTSSTPTDEQVGMLCPCREGENLPWGIIAISEDTANKEAESVGDLS